MALLQLLSAGRRLRVNASDGRRGQAGAPWRCRTGGYGYQSNCASLARTRRAARDSEEVPRSGIVEQFHRCSGGADGVGGGCDPLLATEAVADGVMNLRGDAEGPSRTPEGCNGKDPRHHDHAGHRPPGGHVLGHSGAVGKPAAMKPSARCSTSRTARFIRAG